MVVPTTRVEDDCGHGYSILKQRARTLSSNGPPLGLPLNTSCHEGRCLPHAAGYHQGAGACRTNDRRFWDIAVAAVGESSHMARSNRTAVISLDLAIKPECVEAPHYSCPATDA